MSSRQGIITATYEQLVRTFGEPYKGHEHHKVDVEWEAAPNVYIYNFKNGRNYLGDNGTRVEEITRWHIGGTSQEAVEIVKDRLKSHDDNSIDLEITSG